jgi:hypothetical protein
MRGVLSLLRSGLRPRSEPTRRPVPDRNQRRLYLLGTAFLARGMTAEDAYHKAIYYTEGSGRRQNWISALSEQDSDSGLSTQPKNDSSDAPAAVSADPKSHPPDSSGSG